MSSSARQSAPHEVPLGPRLVTTFFKDPSP
jgi:hypothetical protein